jgi:hypothetical protein
MSCDLQSPSNKSIYEFMKIIQLLVYESFIGIWLCMPTNCIASTIFEMVYFCWLSKISIQNTCILFKNHNYKFNGLQIN